MYPRSGFRSGGTSAETTLLETTLLQTREDLSPIEVQWFKPCPLPTWIWSGTITIGKIPTPIKIKLALPPPPPKKTQNPPLKGGILWAWGFSSRKNPKMPGAHKIGAAISGPRITGGNFMDTTLFLILRLSRASSTSWRRTRASWLRVFILICWRSILRSQRSPQSLPLERKALHTTAFSYLFPLSESLHFPISLTTCYVDLYRLSLTWYLIGHILYGWGIPEQNQAFCFYNPLGTWIGGLKGVGGRGLEANKLPKRAQKFSRNLSPFS